MLKILPKKHFLESLQKFLQICLKKSSNHFSIKSSRDFQTFIWTNIQKFHDRFSKKSIISSRSKFKNSFQDSSRDYFTKSQMHSSRYFLGKFSGITPCIPPVIPSVIFMRFLPEIYPGIPSKILQRFFQQFHKFFFLELIPGIPLNVFPGVLP